MDSFSFTKENQSEIKKIILKYPPDRKASGVMALLDLAQRQCHGYLPMEALHEVSKLLEMPFVRVYEVASFYTMFNLKPIGKFHLQVCGTTPCCLRGAEEIIQACEDHLGIKVGETTPDQLFTLSEVECLGACVNAPVVQLNDDYLEDLTPLKMIEILTHLKEGKKIQIGSQINRQGSKAFEEKAPC